MAQPVDLHVISEQTLVVADGLRPHQVVELLDAHGHRVALYARYLSFDGNSWICHGVFQAFGDNGGLKSDGAYRHGKEHGKTQGRRPWRFPFCCRAQRAGDGRKGRMRRRGDRIA